MSSNFRFLSCVTLLLACCYPKHSYGQSITVLERRVKQTIERVETFHFRANHINDSKQSLAQRKRDLYNEMASQMTVPKEYAHLPFPDFDSSRTWTRNAHKVATGLKPNVNYQVVRGRQDSVICGSDVAISNLYDNVRMIGWYHDQLDKNYSNEEHDAGAIALAGLIDEYLAILCDSLPDVKIRKRGRMNVARDQRLQYSESNLWRILSVVNRYFFYKIQIHADHKSFYKADFLLMNSLIQTAALYGARPPNSSLKTIDLTFSEKDRGWKREAHNALASWDMEIEGTHDYPQQVCAIAIPAKKKPKPPAPKKPEPPKQFPPDVEDIKEIGGQVFLKIKGRWQPWQKK